MDLHDHIYCYLDGHHRLRDQSPYFDSIQGYLRQCSCTRYVRRECKQIPFILYGFRIDHDADNVCGLFQGTIERLANACRAGLYMRNLALVHLGLSRICRNQKQH